jgi:YidC/Oxa1 family membrane protein insertase
MDKKNTVIGVLLLLAAMASFYVSARLAPPTPPAAVQTPTASDAAAPAAGAASTNPGEAQPFAYTPPSLSAAPADYATLDNEFVSVRLTSAGGAIDSVQLQKHKAVLGHPEPYTLNQLHAAPILAFNGFPGLDQAARYEVVSRSATEVVFRTVLDGRLEVTRRYALQPGADPYQIRHETTFRNLTDHLLPLPRAAFSVGTAAPVGPEDLGLYLNVGLYNGDKVAFTKRSNLEGGGFLSNFGIGSKTDLPFIEETAPVVWASVKNQFFATILTPDQPGTGLRVERVKLDPRAAPTDRHAYGVTGVAQFELKPLAAGASTTWGATVYAGPKEYRRLANSDRFKHSEDLIMEFGFFGFFSKLLLTIMTWVHNTMGGASFAWGWGWAIVITTLFLKIVFVPFTIAASRSSKRMAKLMPLVTEVREKYKDNPQKAQTAMMQLYKDHKVNPLGGCIPILITIPFFIGFFSMLQTTSELRFAPFLWAADLAAPDTVAHLFGFPLNIMPLLMGATMIIQMRLTPTPTTDNAQATMMKIMPWIFTLFCYNFSCALALYSTVNGLFTIGQQMLINRLPEPELEKAGADGLKNVTPKKKK